MLLYLPAAAIGLVNQPKVYVASRCCYCQHFRDLKCFEKQYLCIYFSHQKTGELMLSDFCCCSAYPQHAGLISTCCHIVCPTHSQVRCKIVVKDLIQRKDLLDLAFMLRLTTLDAVCHDFIVTSDQVRQLRLQNPFQECQVGNYVTCQSF